MRQAIEEILLADENFVVKRIQMIGNNAGIRQFAICVFRVAHRESLDRSTTDLCHQRGHRAGVDAAAEKNAERHITHQVAAHRLLQHFPVRLDVVTLRAGVFAFGYGKIPVALDPDFPARVNLHPVTRHQLANPAIESLFA